MTSEVGGYYGVNPTWLVHSRWTSEREREWCDEDIRATRFLRLGYLDLDTFHIVVQQRAIYRRDVPWYGPL